MSKIGRVALEAQEEVLNPLGYSTIEEAIADGWDSAEWMAARESEQEKAHEAWLKEKEEVVKELEDAIEHDYEMNDHGGSYVQLAMVRALEFIKGVSHE